MQYIVCMRIVKSIELSRHFFNVEDILVQHPSLEAEEAKLLKATAVIKDHERGRRKEWRSKGIFFHKAAARLTRRLYSHKVENC